MKKIMNFTSSPKSSCVVEKPSHTGVDEACVNCSQGYSKIMTLGDSFLHVPETLNSDLENWKLETRSFTELKRETF